MQWIGITGPMGSGKSSVAAILRRLGYPVLDADQIVGQALSPGEPTLMEIFATFGHGLAGADGALDRRALAAVVFGDPEKLRALETIIHPRVQARVRLERDALTAAGHAVAFYDVPLLFEKNMEAQFDLILVISATREVRLRRAMVRTGLTAAEIEVRWTSQLAPEYKEARASAVIRNDDGEAELRARTLATLTELAIPPARAPRPGEA